MDTVANFCTSLEAWVSFYAEIAWTVLMVMIAMTICGVGGNFLEESFTKVAAGHGYYASRAETSFLDLLKSDILGNLVGAQEEEIKARELLK